MIKSTKIPLNYLLGFSLGLFLLWRISLAAGKQWEEIGDPASWMDGPMWMIGLCALLMPLNCGLDIIKWHWLCRFAQPTTWSQSMSSYFAGVSLSFITPNRIGEYPGRILYLQRRNTIALISVSLLGMLSQLLTLFLFGTLGLVYVNLQFPGLFPLVSLMLCLGALLTLGLAYFFYESWEGLISRIKWLRRFHIYSQLVNRIHRKDQLRILGISILRFVVYTAQYLILLHWAKVLPFGMEGFLLSALFFWTNAMIPGLFLLELGQRTQIGIYIFGLVSDNVIGILTSTVGIWMINLVVPAIIGSVIVLRMKLIR